MNSNIEASALEVFIERLLAADGLRVAVRELRDDDVILVADGRQTAALLGRTPAELRGRTIAELGLPPTLTVPCKALLAQASSTGVAASASFVVEGDAGPRRVLCTAVPVPSEPARQVLFVEAFDDGQAVVAATLVHELANPLLAVTAGIALLERRLRAGAPAADVLPIAGEVHDAAIRATEVLKTMRSLTYASELSVTTTLAELVGEALESVDGAVTIAGPLPDVRVTSGRSAARQILVNLLRNAVEASERAGVSSPVRIAACVSGDGREATIMVIDDGTGIDPAIADRIFEPFATTRPDGTGLGLFVSRALAERIGGRVSVRDRIDGSGAVGELVLVVR